MVAMRLGLGALPVDMGGRHLCGLGALAGIGFTVALFITDLAYSSVPSIGVDPAKIAILAASLVAGVAGAAVLFGATRLPNHYPAATRPVELDLAAHLKVYAAEHDPDHLSPGSRGRPERGHGALLRAPRSLMSIGGWG